MKFYVCVKNIKTYNPTVKFSKLTFNKKIQGEFEKLLSKLVWREIFSNQTLGGLTLKFNIKLQY